MDNKLYTPASTSHIIHSLLPSPLQSPLINIFHIVNWLCQLLVIIDNHVWFTVSLCQHCALRRVSGNDKGETAFIEHAARWSELQRWAVCSIALAHTSLREVIKARWRLNYITSWARSPDPEWLTRQGGWSDELELNYCQSTETWIQMKQIHQPLRSFIPDACKLVL